MTQPSFIMAHISNIVFLINPIHIISVVIATISLSPLASEYWCYSVERPPFANTLWLNTDTCSKHPSCTSAKCNLASHQLFHRLNRPTASNFCHFNR